MEYSGTRPASTLQSPTNHLQADNVQNYGESGTNHSNDVGVLSPAPYSIYDEKQHYQYQNQAPSLNQLLQNNQYGPYGNTSLRPQVSSNYHNNYWNLPRSQNETTRMYYTQYQDMYSQHVNDAAYSKVDKLKCSDHSMVDIERSYISDSRACQNDESDKSRPILHDWKINHFKSETLSPKDNSIKSESDKIIDKSNSIEMPDSVLSKPEPHLNTDYNSNTPCADLSDKNDIIYHNPNYSLDNKISQSQLKHVNQASYDNSNFGQMMMHQNANYYSQLRFQNQQNNTHNYINANNNTMMTNAMNRPPIVNYPPYMQTPGHFPGYGYPQMTMNQVRTPFTAHGPYGPRSSLSPFSGHQDAYVNGSTQPLYSEAIKESIERKEDSTPPVLVKQEMSDSGSTSNKSVKVRSSKSKNAIKNESHPTTPVSNTIPSPSQTSMSSIIDENDDSVSSLGPNDSNVMQHPASQFNQHQIPSNMSQNQQMMYPQPYPNNNQIPHPIIGPYPGHIGSQPRPFAPSQNMMPGRQYHHQNDSPISNSCFQKLLELGTEPERGPWVERYLKFMQENNTPLGAVPTVVKQPLDLFRLYHAVRERGGLLNVVKTKRWKEICHIVNVNASASGAYTLRRNYIKCLLDFECRFDRNGVDPGPILQEIQSLSDKKKKSTTRTTGSSSSSTISSGQSSQLNPDFIGNQSTPRPSLPPQDFNPSHSFSGNNPYNNINHNNPIHNGAIMQRSPMSYLNQRSPYPGPYPGQRMMGGFNTPPSPMHQQQIRYDANSVPPNWTKPVTVMNQQQWSSPSSSSNSNSTHPMQMSMSPGTPTNSIPNSSSSQQSQQVGSLQEHTRRMEWKSNYGGMPPPPAPPPSVQASIRGGSLPLNAPPPSQTSIGSGHPQYHSSVPHCNYPNQTHSSFNQQRPINQSQLPLNMMPQNRHMSQSPVTTNLPDPMKPIGSVSSSSSLLSSSSSSVANSMHNLSSINGHSRAQMDNSRLTQSSCPSQFTYSKSNSNLLKRYDHLFPPNCVEVTQLDYSKKRKYCSKDIKAFNPTTVTMALKSGLVAEVSWALNYLNIWSRDDNFFDKLSLKNIMPLFQALVDVWRNSLGNVFGYDLFIKDLELPVNLEEKVTKYNLGSILKRIEIILKNRQLNMEPNIDENSNVIDDDANETFENLRLVKERIVEMLDCGKYNSDKNGLTVKLDVTSKLDSVFGCRTDLIDFIIGICNEEVQTTDNNSTVATVDAELKTVYCKCPNLMNLWEIGGSDSTFHILPSILSQKNSVLKDWQLHLDGFNGYSGCDTDNCEPPEIKRSRCNSPLTTIKSLSSPTPPNLLHESYNHKDHPNSDDHPHFQNKSEGFSVGESLFLETDEADEEKMLRCLCVSMVIRNLSFVPGNDRIMGSNRSLLVILGRLLLLGHRHGVDECQTDYWWQRWIEDIREHALVTLVNISSYLQLDIYPDGIIQPIIAGLLHWLTCQSPEAEDALPSHRVLNCRRLSLECVMRLCVHERNIDYIVSPPTQNKTTSGSIRDLFDYLAQSFCYPDVQVVREMSLAVMHYLSSSTTATCDSGSIGSIYLANAEPSVISGLITFIEVTESQIRHVVENMGMEALQARPELMGTSLEFLRHSGALLLRIASHEVNRSQFSRDHEMRMLNLVISTVLDQTVAQSISGVLFLLSTSEDGSRRNRCRRTRNDGDQDELDNDILTEDTGIDDNSRFKSFLTFDDLSFCDKDVPGENQDRDNGTSNTTTTVSSRSSLVQDQVTTHENCTEL